MISFHQLTELTTIVMELIKDICSRNLTVKNGQDSLLEEIYKL